MDDVKEAFAKKGLEFISLTESTYDPDRSVLTYRDISGKTVIKEVAMRLSDLEETVVTVDMVDPTDIANFLLKESTAVAVGAD